MTTHLRGRVLQAGALLAVVACGIAVAPAVALASAPDVTITSMPTEAQSGGTLTMKYTVKAKPDDGNSGNLPATITVSGAKSCSGGGCSQRTEVSTDGTGFTANLTMPTVADGTTQTVTITIAVQVGSLPTDQNSTSQSVTVQGQDKPSVVTSVSGKVKDSDGKAVTGAQVALRDSGGHVYSATTNGTGAYSFNSTDSSPISPGSITVGALKTGYESATVTIQGTAGKSATAGLTLKTAAATASAAPSASVSAAASSEATEPTAEEPSGPVQLDDGTTDTKAASNDSGSGSTLFIVLGGLLVAAGIGAIVLVVMRRKSATSDDEGDDPTSMGSGPGGSVPPSQGRFNDATRVAAPMAVGGGATMVAPRAGGTLGDAPTMVQQVEDEFPDPYGAPVPQQGGYQAAAGGWDNQGGDGYGGGNAYGEPAQYGQQPQDNGYGGTYGASAYGGDQAGAYGGQGDQQRYDEPTGMYRPESGHDDGYAGYGDQGGYDQGTQYGGGYDQGGYDQGTQYGGGQDNQYGGGSWGPQGGEHGNAYGGPQAGSGYGPSAGAPVAGGGTYGAPQQPQQQYGTPQGGYDQGGGYGGYDQGQAGAYGQGGYEQPGGGYDQGQAGGGTYGQGGYGYDQGGGQNEQPNRHGGQSRQQEPSQPGQRRSLDWMDN